MPTAPSFPPLFRYAEADQMSERVTDIARRRAEQTANPATDTPAAIVGAGDFSEAFGEDLSDTLDVDTWPPGID